MHDSSDAAGSRPGAGKDDTVFSQSWAPDEEVEAPQEATPAPDERYEDLGLIGEGGMGEVRRVWDRRLRRHLAMKFIRGEHVDQVGLRRRFMAEARLTAALQHPGVVPVHDVGTTVDGRVWYTMREVRGHTLRREITELHQGGVDPRSLRRLIDIFRRLCEVLAYAHSRGVIHRDLKPANVMIGAFGEVQVMDWGLARLVGDAEDHGPGTISGALEGRGRTRLGQVLGTPGYLAPEQARGELADMGPHSDVFALGVILFEILQGERPFHGDAASMVKQAGAQPAPLVNPVMGGRGVRELAALCDRALAFDPAERLQDAGALVEELSAWLEGARLAERARALVDGALPLATEARQRRAEAEDEAAVADALLQELGQKARPEDKQAAWEHQDEAARLRREAAAAEARYEAALRSALELVPGYQLARRGLIEHYRGHLERAEILRDTDGIERFEHLLRGLDPMGTEVWLAGNARLSLETDPPAEVTLLQVQERGRRLVPEPRARLGSTPLRGVAVPRGSLVLHLTAPGHAPVDLPICPRRLERVEWLEQGRPQVLALPLEGELGPEDRYVPPGSFQAGGGISALDAFAPARVYVPGFIIRAQPVTCAEFMGFLNALVDAGDAERAARHAPSNRHRGGDGADALFTIDPEGRYQLAPEVSGRPADPRWPVNWVTWPAAAAYAAWEAERSGLPWRLPTELEWEKAARGADGRAYPWGDHFEAAWACSQSSHEGQPWWAPVDAFPGDVSPYGVRGMGGNVRDWCADAYTRGGGVPGRAASDPEESPDFRVIRGGCWTSSPRACEAASRFAAPPDSGWTSVGFRLVRSWCQSV